MSERIWFCKIGGEIGPPLEGGRDYPMRQAVRKAFEEVTGRDNEFLFSGWGGHLTESERAVVEDRPPAPPDPHAASLAPSQEEWEHIIGLLLSVQNQSREAGHGCPICDEAITKLVVVYGVPPT